MAEAGPGGGQGPEGHGQDLGVAHHHVLEALGVGDDPGPVGLRDRVPRGAGLDDVAVGVHHPAAAPGAVAGAAPAPRRHCRQSSVAGSGWRKSPAAFSQAILRSSAAGRCPRVFWSTAWVSGQVESAWG